jgi:hypothetical protein
MLFHTMNKTPTITDTDLIEALAAIEHEQWMHWSQAVAAEVTDATRSKWQRSWIPYEQLTEDLKEADRVWARKVANLIQQHRQET